MVGRVDLAILVGGALVLSAGVWFWQGAFAPCSFEGGSSKLAICGYLFRIHDETGTFEVEATGENAWSWSQLSIRPFQSDIWFGFSPERGGPEGNRSTGGVRSPLGDLRPAPIVVGDVLAFCDQFRVDRVVSIELELVPPGKTAAGFGFSRLPTC